MMIRGIQEMGYADLSSQLKMQPADTTLLQMRSMVTRYLALNRPATKPAQAMQIECTFCHKSGHDEGRCWKKHGKGGKGCKGKGKGGGKDSKDHDKSRDSCRVCGRNGHWAADCRLKESSCHKCGKKGHLKRMCDVAQASSGTGEHQQATTMQQTTASSQDATEANQVWIFSVTADSDSELEVHSAELSSDWTMPDAAGSSEPVLPTHPEPLAVQTRRFKESADQVVHGIAQCTLDAQMAGMMLDEVSTRKTNKLSKLVSEFRQTVEEAKSKLAEWEKEYLATTRAEVAADAAKAQRASDPASTVLEVWNYKHKTADVNEVCCEPLFKTRVRDNTRHDKGTGQLEFLLDSGADAHLVNLSHVSGLELKPCRGKCPRQLRTAGGHILPVLGEVDVNLRVAQGLTIKIPCLVADIVRPLLSTQQLCKSGFSITVGPQGSSIAKGDTLLWLGTDRSGRDVLRGTLVSESDERAIGRVCTSSSATSVQAHAVVSKAKLQSQVSELNQEVSKLKSLLRDSSVLPTGGAAAKAPIVVTEEERRDHNVTHRPFAAWCPHCTAGAAHGKHQRKAEAEHEQVLQYDFVNRATTSKSHPGQ